MKTLSQHLEDYLRLRRQLGYKMQDAGKFTPQFRALCRTGRRKNYHAPSWHCVGPPSRTRRPTTERQPPGGGAPICRLYERLRCAHGGSRAKTSAVSVSVGETRTIIPMKMCCCWSTPLGRSIHPIQIKGPTLGTLFGLLAVTGMRVGEALALDCGDVDLDRGLLTIRLAKGQQIKNYPAPRLDPQCAPTICLYPGQRLSATPTPGFFVWDGADRLVYHSVNRWFLLVACQVGLRKPGDRRGRARP